MSTAWPQVALGDICNVLRGTMITQAQTTPGDIPVIAGGTGPTYFCSKANREAGVVTISASGANAGYVNFWDEPIFASDCSTVETNDASRTDGRFIFHQLKYLQPKFQASLRKGAAQPHVYAKDVAKLSVVYPPINEQHRIAAILDKADEIRAKRQGALETLESLSQAVFIEMFGDPVTNPMGWKVQPLAKLVEFLDHLRVPVTASDRVPGPIPYYGANGQQDSVADFIFDEPLLLLAEDGGYFDQPERGIAYRIRGKAWVNNHAHVMRPNGNVNLNFLTHAIRNRDVMQFITGSTRAKLTKTGASRIPIALPPLEAQVKFDKMVSRIEKTVDASYRSLASLKPLSASIRNRAFQGLL